MRAILKNTLCIIIIAFIVYLICLMNKPKKMKPLSMQQAKQANIKANRQANPDNINASTLTNANVNRSQQSELVLDRPPLVEENAVIVPANEIIQMNYKDCNSHLYKDKVEKELYTNDLPLFNEKGSASLVALDVNATGHRRINFY